MARKRKRMDDPYNGHCPNCGSRAYIGAFVIECSNGACVRYKKLVVAEKKQDPPKESEADIAKELS